jgi:hypothetical protein
MWVWVLIATAVAALFGYAAYLDHRARRRGHRLRVSSRDIRQHQRTDRAAFDRHAPGGYHGNSGF